MTIFQEYIRTIKQYQREYGPRTIVLYQVGSFYELYSVDDSLINLKEITELLNINLTRKNKSITKVSEANYNMAGIPTFALQKYLKVLVAANYTVVIYEQIDATPTPIRRVAEIISPGTLLTDINPYTTNIIMTAYFEEFVVGKSKKTIISVGVCFLDITTGRSYIGELVSSERDPTFALDELYKYVMMYQPREVILLSYAELKLFTSQQLIAYLELGQESNSNSFVHDQINKNTDGICNKKYQEEFIRKVFPNHGLLTPHEYIGLEFKIMASIAYVYMLNFCYRNNDSILDNIAPPTELANLDSTSCTIAYNAATQLGLSILCKQLNKCRTAIGRRQFRERVHAPITCETTLNKQYDRIQSFITLIDNKDIHTTLVGHLEKIYDMERIYRLLCLQKLQPSDISQISTTMDTVRALNKMSPDLHFSKVGSARDISKEINSYINVDIAQKYSLLTLEENIFVNGTYPDLDELQDKLAEYKGTFTKIAEQFHAEYFKVEYTERDGYYLTITKKRYLAIKSALTKMQPISIGRYKYKWDEFEIKQISSAFKCTSVQLQQLNQKISEIKNKLIIAVKEHYKEFLLSLANKYHKLFTRITEYIADIDWYYSCARCAIDYKYYRPIIERATNIADQNIPPNDLPSTLLNALPHDPPNSYLHAIDLRHPIIERVLTTEEYVPNDILLGNGNPTGILLYGVNSSGKSSLSKAIALVVIMAQVGMFVPANLTYWPYKHIFTRIPSGDDIIKGKSTFIIEITELGNILKRATCNSLVIGDELASGTESISALSIVGAGITQLCSHKSSFVFATHLHDLTAISNINTLVCENKLAISHLAVEYNIDMDCLIYQRKLADGQGSTIYGLEVCKSLNLDTQFMNVANQIRHEVLGDSIDLLPNKKSRYSASVFVDKCKICNKTAQEVHHIKPQELADSAGFIGTIHKNHRSNLIAICEKCHDQIHSGKINVKGFSQTTAGLKLIWKK